MLRKEIIFRKVGFWLIVASTIILFINSSYSPIRDLAYLNYDSTIFYIIGKGIKYGLVPYKDLIDHKGIYIFIVNYLGTLISEYEHIGIFIIQLLISYFNIIVIHRIASLFTEDRRVSLLSTLSIFLIQNSYYFCYGAMKCEGFLSPFIYLSEYLILKYLISGEKEYDLKNIFINGVCAGIVLFTKTNLLLYFLPIIIILLVKSRGNIILVLRYFLYGILGVLAGSAPAIIYCIANNCLSEMMFYNFTINLLYSSELYFKYDTVIEAIVGTFYEYKETIALSLVSIAVMYKARKEILLYYVMFTISSILTLFVALRPYSYYANILAINFLPIFMCIYLFIFKKISNARTLSKIFTGLPLLLGILISYRVSWMVTRDNNYHECLITKEMAKITSNTEKYGNDKSSLVIGAAIPIYNELNIFPRIRFIGTPYISRNLYSEPYDEILRSIDKKENAWLVLSFTPLMIRSAFNTDVRNALKNNYELVESGVYGAEIYHRIDNNN